ncbi:MAG: DUF192 domain-containing protein [Pseudomonadota bacterium]
MVERLAFLKGRFFLRVPLFLALSFGILVAACASERPQQLPVDPDKLLVLSATGSIKSEFDIEIARTAQEQATGLMYRRDLPRNRGMLFVFDAEQERSFWMMNTPASLDIIYADADGVVVSIARAAVPFSTQSIPSRGPAKFVFEVLSGVASEVGLRAGDRLVHPVMERSSE